MNINASFPSAYLKAADLNGQRVTVTMSHVKTEKIGEDERPVLYFQGKEKGLVLNKTNANSIATGYGFETEDWTGQRIELFSMDVDFQGKMVEAIRVKPARRTPAPAPAPVQQAAPARRPAVEIDDSIPF